MIKLVKVKEDITGWIMSEHGVPNSRLKVIRQVEDYIRSNGKHEAQWLCECSCKDHNQIVVRGWCITNGHTLSCGCLSKERLLERSKKYNKYDLSGDFGIGWTSNTNQEFYFDLEDYDKIKDYCWCESVKHNRYHSLVTRDPLSGRTIPMHYILECKYYDHINRNPLDNRRVNLRPCTPSENSTNRPIQSNNTSGIIGVGWNKARNKWKARLVTNHQEVHLGYFINKEDAIRARLHAEQKYFKEFAPQRHLFEEYGITEQND